MPSNFESLNSLDFLRSFKDGDQVDQDDRFKETSDIVADMAENRIEGISDEDKNDFFLYGFSFSFRIQINGFT